jgi:hypothetical protein
MSGNETIVPERLIELANTLDDTVGPELDLAKAYFEQAEIAGDKFSQAGIGMQLAYPGIRQWAMTDSQSKRTDLLSLTDKLAATATTWANAESDNTVIAV